SESVVLPWSIWAIMLKFLICGASMKRKKPALEKSKTVPCPFGTSEFAITASAGKERGNLGDSPIEGPKRRNVKTPPLKVRSDRSLVISQMNGALLVVIVIGHSSFFSSLSSRTPELNSFLTFFSREMFVH